MSQHDDTTRLRHMLEHAQEAVEMIQGRSRRELDRDRMLELALVRLIEIVGEAAARVSDAGQVGHPTIPWLQVVGMRNRLVHGYEQVDLGVLWDTISDDLPALISELLKILDEKDAV